MASASALVGQFGLGFAIAWVSVAAVEAVLHRRRSAPQRRARILELVVAVVVVACLATYGGWRQSRHVAVKRSLDVLLLQTNIGDPINLVNQSNQDAVLDSLTTLYVEWTRQGLDGTPADLIVWPETAFPASPRHGAIYAVQRLAIEAGSPVVFGGYDFQRDATNRWQIYNTLYWIDRQGTVRDRYHKHMLIPIGESIPFERQWPWLRSLVPNAGEFTPGPGPGVMDVDGLWMAPLICYELIFPHYVRRSLQLGGEVLLNVSNDYWFGRTVEPQQHLALARMRAYESGRPIIRCTNTGISALIDSRGQVTQHTGIWRQEILRGTLDVPEKEWTPYSRWGEWMLLAFLVLACVGTGVLFHVLSRSSPSHPTGPAG
jgi:apolipoprotein N-acyltransferase